MAQIAIEAAAPAKRPASVKAAQTTNRRASPRRVGNDPAKTPDRILAVAVREFASKGYAGARVEQIAKRAGVNKQLLYYYFGGKKPLYEAAVREAARRSSESWADLADLPYTDRMAALALRQTENAPLAVFARIMLWESLQQPAGSAQGDRTTANPWSYGRAEVKAAQSRGDLQPHLDTELLTLLLAAVLQLPSMSAQAVRALTGMGPHDAELLKRHANFLRDFMTLLAPTSLDGSTDLLDGSGATG
jgi:TetR/AcrR family transcriptional regulator